MSRCLTNPLRLIALLLMTAWTSCPIWGLEGDECEVCERECPKFAIKSNLLYDAALTPDLGIELSLSERVSAGIEGIYAWWSNDSRHRYWRIRGGWLDVSYWFGAAPQRQRLTGHHAGAYVSLHDYDFEFGGKGWQARNPVFGAGLTYGYSFRLNGRLSLDLNVGVGYAGGNVTEYKPECGRYVCVRSYHNYYFGLTRLGVSLVWFPGRGKFNSPSR